MGCRPFAAVVAAACIRQARRTGRGEIVDVSIYESMVTSMGALGAMAHSVLGVDVPVSSRSIELPSIVPTADGLVGFCTITAQQFEDFLVLIVTGPTSSRTRSSASFAGRIGRREEFLLAVTSGRQLKNRGMTESCPCCIWSGDCDAGVGEHATTC